MRPARHLLESGATSERPGRWDDRRLHAPCPCFNLVQGSKCARSTRCGTCRPSSRAGVRPPSGMQACAAQRAAGRPWGTKSPFAIRAKLRKANAQLAGQSLSRCECAAGICGRVGHCLPARAREGGDATLERVAGSRVQHPDAATRAAVGLPLVRAARGAVREVSRIAASRSPAGREGAQPALPHPVRQRLLPAGDSAPSGLIRRCMALPDWVVQVPRLDSTVTRLLAPPSTSSRQRGGARSVLSRPLTRVSREARA